MLKLDKKMKNSVVIFAAILFGLFIYTEFISPVESNTIYDERIVGYNVKIKQLTHVDKIINNRYIVNTFMTVNNEIVLNLRDTTNTQSKLDSLQTFQESYVGLKLIKLKKILYTTQQKI